jgi:hypothetical protein
VRLRSWLQLKLPLKYICLEIEKVVEQGEVPDDTGRVPVTGSVSMGWQKHSSGIATILILATVF